MQQCSVIVLHSYVDRLSVQVVFMIESSPICFELCEGKKIPGAKRKVKKIDQLVRIPYLETADKINREFFSLLYHEQQCIFPASCMWSRGYNEGLVTWRF